MPDRPGGTDPLRIRAGEREVVRVFAADLDPAEAEALSKSGAPNGGTPGLARLLGAPTLDIDHVEFFPARDLKGIGLAGYIVDGLGVAADDVAPDRVRLEAARGHVVIVHSAAASGAALTLAPAPELRHLGTYRMAGTEPPAILTPPATPGDSAAGAVSDKTSGPPARLSRLITLLGLLAAATIVLALAFMVGSGR